MDKKVSIPDYSTLFNRILWSYDRVIAESPFQNHSANPGKEKHYGEETHGNFAIFSEKEQEMEYIAVCPAGGVNCSLPGRPGGQFVTNSGGYRPSFGPLDSKLQFKL